MKRSGVVYLVGAGPGDPGLITVKGAAALRAADVVVYDHLVSPRLLDSCRPGTDVIYVGKEHGRHTKTQDEINDLLVRRAKLGKTVVRLKGGDPVLFGRAGEEALALSSARVAYEIVPGVTSALAVPAYAGIPVTHRELSSSVAIVTGHEDADKDTSTVRWSQLAGADTLVCLMGVLGLPSIARRLIEHGRKASTPCAVIRWGTTAAQQTVVGTLATIAERCRAAGVRPPAVVVIGDVVRLRKRLNWFERRPLFGWRIVVTRPAERADVLARLLEAAGASVEVLPAVVLEPVHANGVFHETLGMLDRIDWVFFTSPESIRQLRRQLAAERKDLRILLGRHIGAIGPKTAESIHEMGIHVDFTPATFTQDGMLHGLARRQLAGKRAVIFGSAQGRDALEQGLRARGMDVRRVPLYRPAAPPELATRLRRVLSERVDLVTVTSSSCVEHLVDALKTCGMSRSLPRLRFASIGPVTTAAVRQRGGVVAVEASSSTVEGLVEAIVDAAQRNAIAPSGRAPLVRRGRSQVRERGG